MRKQGGIFQKWFSSFANAVFIQSFHAVILTFALKFLQAFMNMATGTAAAGTETDFIKVTLVKPDQDYSIIISVMAFICLTAVTRFEKVLKDLFGIGESKHLGNTIGNFHRVLSGVNATTSMIKKVASPAMKGIRAHKQLNEKDIYGKTMKDRLDGFKGKYVQQNANGYYSMIDKESQSSEGTSGINSTSPSGSNSTVDNELSSFANTLTEKIRVQPDYEPINYHKEQAREERELARQEYNKARLAKEHDNIDSYNDHINRYNEHKASAQEHSKQYNELLRSNKLNQQTVGSQQANQEAQNAATSRGSQPVNVHNDINVDIKGGQGKATSTTDSGGKTTTNVRTKDTTGESKDERKAAEELVKKYNEARKARNIAVADTLFNAGSTFAGVGFAAGAWDEFHEITNAGNMISQPFVSASTTALNWNEDRRMKNKTPAKTKVTVNRDVEVEYNDNVNVKGNNFEQEFKKKVARSQAKKNLDVDGGTRDATVHTQTNVNRDEKVNYNNSSRPESYTSSKNSSPINIYSQQDVNEVITQNHNVSYQAGKQNVSGTQVKPIGNVTQNVKSTHEINEDITQNRNVTSREGKTNVKGYTPSTSSNDTVTKVSSTNTIFDTQEVVRNIQKNYKEITKSGKIPYDSQAILSGRDRNSVVRNTHFRTKDLNELN